jgi:hypothetical protein
MKIATPTVFFLALIAASVMPCAANADPDPRQAASGYAPMLDLLSSDHDFLTLQTVVVPGSNWNYFNEASSEIPIALSDDTFFVTGFDAARYRFSRRGGVPTEFNTLSQLSTEAGIGTMITDDLLVVAQIYPGWYSNDLGRTGSSFARLPADIIGNYRIAPSLAVTAGIWTLDTLDGSALRAAGGISGYFFDHAVHLTAVLPFEARVGWQCNDALEWYGGFWTSGAKYNAMPGEVEANLDYERFGAGARIAVLPHVHMSVEGGMHLKSERRFGNNVGIAPDAAIRPYVGITFGFSL